MTDQPGGDLALFPREFVADAGYSTRLSSEFVRFMMARPSRIILPLLIIVAVAVVGILLRIDFWWLLPIAGAIGWVLGAIITRRRLRRRMREIAPDGGHYSIEFRPGRLAIATPRGFSETDYRSYEEIVPRGEFVFLKVRSARMYTVLPAALFTPESLQLLRDRMRIA